MRYWWVNQNKTFRHEYDGGYLWSPKRKANGHTNPFYEFMREVSPGDVVLSFSDTYICAVGIALSNAYECPKPEEFGSIGRNWELVGWKVDVDFRTLTNPIRPAEHIEELRRHLPQRYAPLQFSGAGLQGVYLTEVSVGFALAVADLVGMELRVLISGSHQSYPEMRADANRSIVEWEEHLREEVVSNPTLDATEKRALVLARRGQGRFKENVCLLERACRVTKVDRIEHLRASHCKPWRDATDTERLDGENGLLLTPSVDHLFDRGFISFEDRGELLISPVAHLESLRKMGIPVGVRRNVGTFSEGQRRYLEYHRNEIFLEARVRR